MPGGEKAGQPYGLVASPFVWFRKRMMAGRHHDHAIRHQRTTGPLRMKSMMMVVRVEGNFLLTT